MFTQSAARRTTDWLVQGGCVKAEERVVYEFGLDKMISSCINFFFALLLGALFGVLVQTVLFYVTYVALRVYAGGYHAEKAINCFWASIVVLVPCLVVIRFYQTWNTALIFWGLLAVSAVVLVKIGPVEHKNKPLDATAKVVYRRRLLRNLAVAVAVVVGLRLFSLEGLAVAMLCGMVLTAMAAGVGKVQAGIAKV